MSALSETVDSQLEGVPETLLIPLWARAQEQKRADPIIIDPDAARIVESLDYDFDRLRMKRVETENFCVRSRVLDNLIRRMRENR
jgi:O-methyltransferase involved in polyketide biosynthesis